MNITLVKPRLCFMKITVHDHSTVKYNTFISAPHNQYKVWKLNYNYNYDYGLI